MAPQFEQQVLFPRESGAWCRIPSLAVTPAGTVLAFCGRRKGSFADFGHDTDLLLRRSTDGGATFEPAVTIASRPGIDVHTGPVVVDAPAGRILKFCRFWPAEDGMRIVRNRPWECMRERGFIDHLLVSDDDGATWSEPRPVEMPFPEGVTSAATGNGVHGVQLEGGRLLVQGGYCVGADTGGGQRHVCTFASDDGGATWRLGATAPFLSIREFCMAQLADGTIYYNLRNHGPGGRRLVSWGEPGGEDFGRIAPDPDLPEPVCHAGLARLRPAESPGVLAFSNPACAHAAGGEYSQESRRRLEVRLSYDGGRTWPAGRLLWAERAGYSDLAASPDGTIHCLYERGPESGTYHDEIACARFDRAWAEAT